MDEEKEENREFDVQVDISYYGRHFFSWEEAAYGLYCSVDQ